MTRASGRASAATALLLGAALGCSPASPPTPRPVGPEGADLDEVCRRNNLGVALADHGGFEEAAREFRAALAAWDGCAVCRVNLGIALYYGRDPESARAELEAALRLDPEAPRAHYLLGLYHAYVTARHEEAARHFQAVARADPDDAWTQFYLGLSLLKSDGAEDAVVALRRSVSLDPGLLAARYHLSLALRRSGRTGDADVELAAFTRRRAEMPAGSATPGVGYLEQGRWAETEAMSRPGAPGVSLVPDRPLPELIARLGEAPALLQVAAADLNNDGRLDRLRLAEGVPLLRLDAGGGSGGGRAGEVGLGPRRGSLATAAALADVDHDGDVDVYVCRDGSPNELFRNDGAARFVEIGGAAGVDGGPGRSLGAVFADFDADRAIDLCVARAGAPPLLFFNNRDGTFAERAAAAGLAGVAAASGVLAGDLDHDGYADLVFVPDGPGPLRVFLGSRGRRFTAAAPPPAAELSFARPVCGLLDADLDGDLDVVCLDLVSDASEPVLFANQHLAATGGVAGRLTVRARGRIRPQVLSNFAGLGTKLEVRAAGLWLRREVQSATGDLGAAAGEVAFGLGGVQRLDYVRAVYPSGVRLTLRDVAAGSTVEMEEPAGKYTSCPMIYAWDGARFAFVGDALGAAVLGEWEPPGRWMRPDPDEWIALDEGLPSVDDGVARLRFVDQLDEADLLDVARLVAVDHPDTVEVLPDERLRLLASPAPGDPKAAPALRVVAGSRPARGARDARGRDVTAALARRDGRWHDDLALLPWAGLARDHVLELEAPGPLDGDTVVLLHGWTEWGSSSSLKGAWQAGVAPRPVRLEALAPGGAWVTLSEDAGVPAGLPRTIAVPMERVPPAGARRLRLTTNLTVLWDEARFGRAAASEVRVHELPLRAATLRRIGYPRPERTPSPDRLAPVRYLYDRRDASAEWEALPGAYTRLGDVLELAAAGDDRLVVMTHGEEVALDFSADGLPPIPPGWKRRFLLYARGYGKDRDVNSASPATVEPLPFAAMPGYPYAPARDPLLSPPLLDSYLAWNRRAP